MVDVSHEGLRATAGQAAPGQGGGPVLFDAVLTPHRSLSTRQFRRLMAVIAGASLVLGTAFLTMGAWPIFGFLGLDVLAIYAAFRLNFRAARLYETVILTPEALTVERVSPRGDAQRWQFQPAWLKVLMDDPPEHDSRLTLRSHGRNLSIGSFLTPEERLDLAKALRGALARTSPAPQP